MSRRFIITAALCAITVTAAQAGEPPRSATPPSRFFVHEFPPFDPPRLTRDEPVTRPPKFVFRNGYSSTQLNVDEFGANIIGDVANEPTIAIDPTDPDNIVCCWREYEAVGFSSPRVRYALSHDGGQTWATGTIDAGVFRTDPVLAVSASGTFYLYSPNEDFDCDLFVSTDKGETWSAPIPAYGSDRPWVVVDRSGGTGDGNIYCTFSGTNSFTRSTDGGTTWLTPLPMSGIRYGGTLTVGPDGTVYAYGLSSQFALKLVRSSNAQDPGATPAFDLAGSAYLGGGYPYYGAPNPQGFTGQPWIACDHSDGPYAGTLYALCSVIITNNADDVMFNRSTDRGETWGTAVRINDDPLNNGSWQWMGTMSVAPNGRIDVIWNDTYGFESHWSTVVYAYSFDGGTTWLGHVPVSPPFDSHIGWPNRQSIGDYYHMLSDDAVCAARIRRDLRRWPGRLSRPYRRLQWQRHP